MLASLLNRAITPMVAMIAVMATLFFSSPAAAQLTEADAKEAKQFIVGLGDTAIDALTKKGMSKQDREEQFRSLLKENFNVGLIGRFVLGKFWRKASQEERDEFLGLFETYVVSAYANRFKDYGGQKFVVVDARVKKRDIWVDSKIERGDPNAPDVRVRWRVRRDTKNGNALRIVDVVVEGISMSITQRDEFASVIQQGGGKVASLNAQLRARTSQ